MSKIYQRITDLTIDEFIEILEKHSSNAFQPDPVPIPLTRKVQLKTLGSIYGWGESTIYKWCRQKTIPHSRVEGEYWFDLDVIEQWIDSHKVITKHEVIQEFEKRGRKNMNKKTNHYEQ